jgi:uncharacterized protein
MANKITREFNKIIFKKINRSLIKIYDSLADIFTTTGKGKRHVYLYPELRKMNKLMRSFFHHPDLQLTATNNLVPVKIETEDGVVLDALQYITNPDSDKWIISCHWFAGDKYWGLYLARAFIELGYNVLVFDFRNHGKSQKDQPVTMGFLETSDLLAVMKWLYENHKYQHLALMGVSMGAYAVNYVQAKYPKLMKKYRVRFAISDATYGSIKSLLLHIRNVRIRHIVRKKTVGKKINEILNVQNDATGFNWYDIDIFKLYEQDNQPAVVPTFFSHGLNDLVTPPTDTLRLFADRKNKASQDEIIIYNFSTHAMSLKEHYVRQIYHWIMFENKIMGDDERTKKALEKFNLTQDLVLNNPEERYEVYTFYLNPNSDQKGEKKRNAQEH